MHCKPLEQRRKVIKHFERVVFPYLKKKKAQLELPEEQKAMLIFDVFKGQVTKQVTKLIEENDCVIFYVPNNMTDQFQPLNLNEWSCERVFKEQILMLVRKTSHRPNR